MYIDSDTTAAVTAGSTFETAARSSFEILIDFKLISTMDGEAVRTEPPCQPPPWNKQGEETNVIRGRMPGQQGALC